MGDGVCWMEAECRWQVTGDKGAWHQSNQPLFLPGHESNPALGSRFFQLLNDILMRSHVPSPVDPEQDRRCLMAAHTGDQALLLLPLEASSNSCPSLNRKDNL